MFTGIVELSASIVSVKSSPGGGRRLAVATSWKSPADRPRLGASIAVNGCCLTVANIAGSKVSFDVIPETLSKTNLGALQACDKVHLERALRIGDRLDGHFVQGHVDGTATLVRIRSENGIRLELRPPAALFQYITPHGSVTIDGVSLTVARIHKKTFEVALIPTTLKMTQLASHVAGWRYNFEADMLVKSVIYWRQKR